MAKKKAKKQNEKQTQHVFKQNDLVAAKVKGYPTWPGRVERVDVAANGRTVKYHVRFFGTNDRSCKFVDLKPFEEFTPSELNCSRRGFSHALELCRQEYECKKPDCNKKAQRSGNRGRLIIEQLGSNEDNPCDDESASDDELPREEDETPAQSMSPADFSCTRKDTSDRPPLESPSSEEKHSPDNVETEPIENNAKSKQKFSNDIHDSPKNSPQTPSHEQQKIEIELERVDSPPTNRAKNVPTLTPQDQCPKSQPTKLKSEESTTKDCSLNDLTSEKANADRGQRKSAPKTQTNNNSQFDGNKTQETKKELTIAKLKKKIDLKLEEKANLKKAILERKSFEKASKILPKFTLIFDPLITSSQKLIENLHEADARATNQFRTSIKNCEKYLDLLEKCLRAMLSEYGKKQRESYLFHTKLIEIVIDLKKIRKSRPKTDLVSRDAANLLKLLRDHRAIKDFINSVDIPDFSSESITERKENATKHQRVPR